VEVKCILGLVQRPVGKTGRPTGELRILTLILMECYYRAHWIYATQDRDM
jgi:hypothetical protein